MALSIATIQGTVSDHHLETLIRGELNRLLPDKEGRDPGYFLKRLSKIPVGFQAMAVMYQLDVSMALDDLGCHFNNWHHRGYIEKQIWALRELELEPFADVLSRAYEIASPYWDEIGSYEDFGEFCAWYNKSELYKSLDPLNVEMWALCAPNDRFEGMLGQWPRYARKYPERLQDTN